MQTEFDFMRTSGWGAGGFDRLSPAGGTGSGLSEAASFVVGHITPWVLIEERLRRRAD